MTTKDLILKKRRELEMQIWALLKTHRIKDPQEVARSHCPVDCELQGEQIAIEIVKLLARILDVDLRPEPLQKPELGIFRWKE